MLVTFLTKSGGILGPIASLFGMIMNLIYEFFNLFGIQNIALSIIIFTFITRALILPLTIKQMKFTKLSSKMNPELQKIQAKYKGKKDEASLRKQQEETQIVYEKYGANPTAGCLPLIIQLPIIYALYRVIYNIPAYVNHVYNLYDYIALQVQKVANYPSLLTTLSEGVKNNTVKTFTDTTSTTSIIDLLSKLSVDKWKTFTEMFANIPNAEKVTSTISDIQNVNTFFDLNIANSPMANIFVKSISDFRITALLIPLLAAGLQFYQTKMLQSKNKNDNQDNPAAAAMNSMNVVMPMMTLFFCSTFPIGIGLYWIAQSLFAIVQQYFVNKYLDRIDIDDLIKKNLSKKGKKKTYTQPSGMSVSELARKQTKFIESTVPEKNTNLEKDGAKNSENEAEVSSQTEKKTGNPKSVSEIANLLKNRNEKGDK